MQCWKSYEVDAIISILQMWKLRLSDIQKHHHGIEWMTKVRLPLSRTDSRSLQYATSPCFLAYAATFLISTPTLHLPSKIYFPPSCLLPIQTPMSSYPIFSLPCPALQRWFQGIMGLQKSREQEEVCINLMSI